MDYNQLEHIHGNGLSNSRSSRWPYDYSQKTDENGEYYKFRDRIVVPQTLPLFERLRRKCSILIS